MFMNVFDKNFAKICCQSNYYLRTLSHVACQILTLNVTKAVWCQHSSSSKIRYFAVWAT